MKLVNKKRLYTSAGVEITALAMPNANGVVYSETLNLSKNMGFISALFNESHAGASGNVNIYMQYSMDGVNFYQAYSTAAAALTIDPDIVDTLTNEIRFVEWNPRLAPYGRLAFNPVADSVLTVDVAFQEEV